MMKTSLMVKKKNKQTTKKFIRVITIYQWHSRYGPILITYEINLHLRRIAPINQQTEARKGLHVEEAAECVTYSTNYNQRIVLESWFTNLEQTPINRCLKLPAP